uniref:NADH-ubiquinone oxidoreductase chain 2 n=1 Tax=Ophioplocus japonicus TaxID=35056 RepID=A0A513X084_9ECHI|nr:NADH dehydrogenase subunit 2 [Ophioplocus japonicus]QDH07346.1 NADH dehydrogenase subunit 2 [Ophioplocus japonicus]
MGSMFVYNVFLGFGILVVLFSSNWVLVWVMIELSTLVIVALLSHRLSPRAVESTSKYFIIQAVASVFLLSGVLVRYYLLGEILLFSEYEIFSYGLVMLGLLVKLAVFPNPFWFVDVVSGLSLFRSVYVILLSKVVPLYLYVCLSGGLWAFWFVVVGVSSVVVGSVLGINQTSVRKVVALSSVSHLGWMVAGFPFLSWFLCFFVFFGYVLMVIPLVFFGGLFSFNFLVKSKNVYYNPVVVFCVVLSLLSLGGFPPLLGFFYKWILFYGLVSGGFYLFSGVLVVLSLVSLFFYLQICYSLCSVYWPELKFSLYGGIFRSFMFSLSNFGLAIISFCSLVLVFGICCLGPLSFFWFF